MKALIIGGFLGAGKTSIVLQIAKYIVANTVSDSEYKIAIIENEVGEVGVDDVALRGGGYEVTNLFAGCACCTSSGEIPSTVEAIRRDLNPDWIILEPTGVAYPMSIKTLLEEACGVESTICIVVDAKRWLRFLLPMGSLLPGQLQDATTILINKMDLITEQELVEITESVSSFNSTAEIFPVCAAETIDDAIWEQVISALK